jgi:DNA-binding NarL/FixJ family response regulator
MLTTVLLADDHALVRDGLRALIERNADMKVIGEAGDGQDAVAETRQLQPDAVVMDIAMPVVDGVAATRRIKQECPGTKVLILSMYLRSDHIRSAFDAGADGYVLKECAGAEVMEALRALRAGRRYLSHRVTETVLEERLLRGGNATPLDALTLRERDVLRLVLAGRTNDSIAEALSLSSRVVEGCIAQTMKKLGVRDTVALVQRTLVHGRRANMHL